jgi:hypothetical protein
MISRKIGSRFAAEVYEPLGAEATVHIVKTSNGERVPDDEPLFLLRARDRLAIPLLRHFRELCRADGCTTYMLGLCDLTIAQFERFAAEHPEQMKQPGVTRGR